MSSSIGLHFYRPRRTGLDGGSVRRAFRACLVAIVALYGVGDVAAVQAQSCPQDDPLVFTYGNLVVLEGPVVEPEPGEPLSRGHDAGVALDDPATGGARFLVSWVSDEQQDGNNFFDTVLATGFSAEGDCVAGPKNLSDHGSCPVLSCDILDFAPSVAMSADHRVRVGWVGFTYFNLLGAEKVSGRFS